MGTNKSERYKNLDNLTSYEVANMILCERLDTKQTQTLIEEFAEQQVEGSSKQQTKMETVKFEGLIEARNKAS